MKWLALDIGGANLKAADGEGFAVSLPFPMWENSHQLVDALRRLLSLVPRVTHVAATMTGELADCFTTKAQGVQFILNALGVAADGRHTRVYLTNGRLVSLQTGLRQPLPGLQRPRGRRTRREAPHGCRPTQDGEGRKRCAPESNARPSLPQG